MDYPKSEQVAHVEVIENASSKDEYSDHGFTTDSDSLPAGYYRSPFFLGTMLATGFALCAGVGGFAVAAPNLALINADIGPDPNYVWIGLIYTMALAIGLLLVGRLSDLFGYKLQSSFGCNHGLIHPPLDVGGSSSLAKCLLSSDVLSSQLLLQLRS